MRPRAAFRRPFGCATDVGKREHETVNGALLQLVLGSVLSIGGVSLLRAAWGQPRRSAALNGAGWSALTAGVVIAAMAEGAWGAAIAAMAAMLAAAAFLGAAAVSSAVQAGRTERQRSDVAAPRSELAMGRRTAVFLLVVPGAFVASFLIALAALVAARQAGWSEANAIPLAFFLFPIVWTTLVLLLMLKARLRTAVGQLAAVAAGAGAVAWVLA